MKVVYLILCISCLMRGMDASQVLWENSCRSMNDERMWSLKDGARLSEGVLTLESGGGQLAKLNHVLDRSNQKVSWLFRAEGEGGLVFRMATESDSLSLGLETTQLENQWSVLLERSKNAQQKKQQQQIELNLKEWTMVSLLRIGRMIEWRLNDRVIGQWADVDAEYQLEISVRGDMILSCDEFLSEAMDEDLSRLDEMTLDPRLAIPQGWQTMSGFWSVRELSMGKKAILETSGSYGELFYPKALKNGMVFKAKVKSVGTGTLGIALLDESHQEGYKLQVNLHEANSLQLFDLKKPSENVSKQRKTLYRGVWYTFLFEVRQNKVLAFFEGQKLGEFPLEKALFPSLVSDDGLSAMFSEVEVSSHGQNDLLVPFGLSSGLLKGSGTWLEESVYSVSPSGQSLNCKHALSLSEHGWMLEAVWISKDASHLFVHVFDADADFYFHLVEYKKSWMAIVTCSKNIDLEEVDLPRDVPDFSMGKSDKVVFFEHLKDLKSGFSIPFQFRETARSRGSALMRWSVGGRALGTFSFLSSSFQSLELGSTRASELRRIVVKDRDGQSDVYYFEDEQRGVVHLKGGDFNDLSIVDAAKGLELNLPLLSASQLRFDVLRRLEGGRIECGLRRDQGAAFAKVIVDIKDEDILSFQLEDHSVKVVDREDDTHLVWKRDHKTLSLYHGASLVHQWPLNADLGVLYPTFKALDGDFKVRSLAYGWLQSYGVDFLDEDRLKRAATEWKLKSSATQGGRYRLNSGFEAGQELFFLCQPETQEHLSASSFGEQNVAELRFGQGDQFQSLQLQYLKDGYELIWNTNSKVKLRKTYQSLPKAIFCRRVEDRLEIWVKGEKLGAAEMGDKKSLAWALELIYNSQTSKRFWHRVFWR